MSLYRVLSLLLFWFAIGGCLASSVSAQANMPEYPLLTTLIERLDQHKINCLPVTAICPAPTLIIKNKGDSEVIISAAYAEKTIAMTVSRSFIGELRFEQIGTYIGPWGNIKVHALQNDLPDSAIFWYTDKQGLLGIAQRESDGNLDINYRGIRIDEQLVASISAPGPFPRPWFEIAKNRVVITLGNALAKLEVNRGEKKEFEFVRSSWYGDSSDGGFCYVMCTDTAPSEDFPTGPDHIALKAFTAQMKEGKLVNTPVTELNTADLDELIGGNVAGILPTGIRRLSEPTGSYQHGIVYLPLKYSYVTADESITVQGIVRLIKEKAPAFADLQIAYRNSTNPLLNANWDRDKNGGFMLLPSSEYPILYCDYSEITNNMFMCTVNGGRIWLLNFE